MDDFKTILFSKAFLKVPGQEYNRVSYELRETRDDKYKIFYEVILSNANTWENLRDRVYPSFIRFLKYKSLDPETADGVIISVFYKDYFYLIEGGEFLNAFCEIEGLNKAAFHFQVIKWLSS